MKLALVNPPTLDNEQFTREGRCTQSSSFWSITYPPLSLAQISSFTIDLVSDQYGFDFSATGTDYHSSLDRLENLAPEIIVISTGTPTIVTDLKFCRDLKEKLSCIKIILIGTHSSHYAEEILRDFKEVDFIIHGEAEAPIREVISYIKDELKSDNPIKGVSFLYENRLIQNKELNLVKDLDSLRIPNWKLFDLNSYRLPLLGRKFLLISPQRGCPWKCTFCTAPLYSGSSLRSRSIDSIIQEITSIKLELGITDFLFWSDTFTANKKFVLELCKALEPLNINWVTNSRIDTIDAELSKAMKRSGCWLLTFGIESTNDETLLEVKKGFSRDQIRKGIESLKGSGILTIAHIIAGLPKDTPKNFKDTFKDVSSLGFDYIQSYMASPFPGTEFFYNEIKDENIKEDPYLEFSQESSLSKDDSWSKSYKSIKFRSTIRMKSIIFIFLCAIKSSYLYGIFKNKRYI
ncbi:MAG: radical SAM superfamily enzyme YgiQ (UPF0313 family) [Bacteriovoracaceae bacterium]|jgi:radical SAM superfamily enzyme YgiQ (UPF0313 family)